MKTVYEAANAVEAHMLADLLKQEGVAAQIHGEHLQGAVGELPAAGLVRLVVDESDFSQARAAIERWDAAASQDRTPAPPRRRSTVLLAWALGLAMGAAGCYAFFRSPATVDGIDHNRDGLLDEKSTYAPSGTLLSVEIDRNLDRKVDVLARYDARGLIESARGDDDFDGVFETQSRYRDGNVVLTEADTDADGVPDLRSIFENGVLSSMEYMNPSTGLPLRVEYFKLGKLTHADVDTDKDGILDTRQRYSPLGDVTGSERIPR